MVTTATVICALVSTVVLLFRAQQVGLGRVPVGATALPNQPAL
jgi:hypothetical protein